jgi:hypothetical protein
MNAESDDPEGDDADRSPLRESGGRVAPELVFDLGRSEGSDIANEKDSMIEQAFDTLNAR